MDNVIYDGQEIEDSVRKCCDELGLSYKSFNSIETKVSNNICYFSNNLDYINFVDHF